MNDSAKKMIETVNEWQSTGIRETIKHCEKCGGNWVDDGINSGCYCSRLDDAEAVLKGMKCDACHGRGDFASFSSKERPKCGQCLGSGLHPDAKLFFERWK